MTEPCPEQPPKPTGRWRDRRLPLDARVAALLGEMTLEEKLAQLVGVWVGVSDSTDEVAPAQHEFAEPLPPWDELTKAGLGQLTRVFGTAPVAPATGARVLARTQRDLVANCRLGIPAMAHEECLSGFTAWQATVFPTPLAWGAAFDPELVKRMSRAVGDLMRSVGVHQGLAPVLDVCRDPRWGRTEETIGEDPYLVGTIGTAYVQGLEEAGIVATLKHFAGYSASQAGRNHAPVSMGRREYRDVILPPFEMALREGGARAVMQSYAAVDGVPPASDETLLTGLLRDEWGFSGVVVADYFAVSFLETMHGVADSPASAAALALRAGVDVELPTVRCYGDPLADAVRNGEVPETLVDRAVARVLRQKAELGLLDDGWDPTPPALAGDADTDELDFDPPHARAAARDLAERSVVLVDNRSSLLPAQRFGRLAVVGPCADDPLSLMGCYAFPNHVGERHPDAVPLGIEVPTVLDALRSEYPGAEVRHARGCPMPHEAHTAADTAGTGHRAHTADDIEQAVRLASDSDVCVAVLGDRAGLFGRGTSGEGCDAEDLALPGRQGELLDALLGTGVPVVVVMLSGRPYALGPAGERVAALLHAYFPGEEGAGAVAGVISGRVNPSGRLPIQVPRVPGGQPATYLGPKLATRTGVSSADPTPRFPFGHGLSYTSFDYSDLEVTDAVTAGPVTSVATDGAVDVSCVVRNSGRQAGAEVVQLYLHDPVASVTRPVRQLIGYARVELDPGQAARVTFRVHADRTSFTGRDLKRRVEPGDVELLVGASSEDVRLNAALVLTGEPRVVDHQRVLTTPVTVRPLA